MRARVRVARLARAAEEGERARVVAHGREGGEEERRQLPAAGRVVARAARAEELGRVRLVAGDAVAARVEGAERGARRREPDVAAVAVEGAPARGIGRHAAPEHQRRGEVEAALHLAPGARAIEERRGGGLVLRGAAARAEEPAERDARREHSAVAPGAIHRRGARVVGADAPPGLVCGAEALAAAGAAAHAAPHEEREGPRLLTREREPPEADARAGHAVPAGALEQVAIVANGGRVAAPAAHRHVGEALARGAVPALAPGGIPRRRRGGRGQSSHGSARHGGAAGRGREARAERQANQRPAPRHQSVPASAAPPLVLLLVLLLLLLPPEPVPPPEPEAHDPAAQVVVQTEPHLPQSVGEVCRSTQSGVSPPQ